VATGPLREREEDTRSRSAQTDRSDEHTRSGGAPRRGRPQAGPPSTAGRDPARGAAPRGRVPTVSRLVAVLLVLTIALTAAPAASAAPPSGPWSLPLAGEPVVSRSFDRPPTPYAAGHRGVDLAGGAGRPVLSAGAGVVAFAGLVAGRPVVSVQHAGGLRTTYEPVQPGVAAGQAVARGSPLGVLAAGHAGCPVEACLHWGLRRGETYLDPLALLRPPRVRLLPWP
jgi:murein DD-endopeptidase MepM/ murein hydrolase activator NlpD